MALRVFNPGDVLAAADVNEYLVNNRYAIKPADTARFSTTTPANDPDLTIAVDANKTYFVNMTVLFTAVNGTGDLQFQFTIPAGTVFSGTATDPNGVVPYTASPPGRAITTLLGVTGAGTGTVAAIVFNGVLATGGSSGSFTFQWSQQTSNATSTTVKQGSHMFLRRVS